MRQWPATPTTLPPTTSHPPHLMPTATPTARRVVIMSPREATRFETVALPHARLAYEERRSRLGDAHRETRESRLSLVRLEGDEEAERELVEADAVE
jgi:hypothetical protein